MKKNKDTPKYNVLVWNFNYHRAESYDIMPHFINEWKKDKKRKHKIWNLTFNEECDKNIDDTKMPETFDEFKKYLLRKSVYQYLSKCEYEIVISDWPCQSYEQKIDVHYQIEMNINVITKLFMNYILE